MTQYIVNIQGQGVELDQPAMDDLCILLTTYHGRLSKAVGESSDMGAASQLADHLLTVQEVYDALPTER